MSYSEVEFVDAEESQANSCLYARVNIENKTNRRKKNLEKRISNKYEFVIPVESSELSTSDLNLRSTLVSRVSLLSSRAIFGSADNIISDKSLQSESPVSFVQCTYILYSTRPKYLDRHNFEPLVTRGS